MSKQVAPRGASIRGTLSSRLLINTFVDPDEVTPHPPAVVGPHVTSGADLQSEFLTQFTTAEPAPSYLMRDVDVVWTKERAPRTSLERADA